MTSFKWVSRAFGSLIMVTLAAIGPAQADQTEETTQAKFQTTFVWMKKPSFPANYSGTNSFASETQEGYSLSTTAMLGVRTWSGGELYFNPEMIMSNSLSRLAGLGGLSNGEDQKGGGSTPTLYTSRLFVRQTFGFGGDKDRFESSPNQLAGEVDKHRMVLTAGKFSLIDIFDNNSFSHDPRTQFLNWSLMTHGAFDYAADQRGYTEGVALEYYRDDMVFRIGRFKQPIESNGLPLDARISTYHGDQIEIEHRHEIGRQPGQIHLLAFRNTAHMASFQDALDYWNAQGRVGVPDLGNVRKDQNKVGFGINFEQNLTQDTGLFLRVSKNDGGEETYAFTEIEQSISGGILTKGISWNRSGDTLGIAYAQNGLSAVHQQYLANGGLGAFIGDGNLNYQPEGILECFYNLAVMKKIWLSFDYQRITNPAYNADRGPAQIFGSRLHLEY